MRTRIEIIPGIDLSLITPKSINAQVNIKTWIMVGKKIATQIKKLGELLRNATAMKESVITARRYSQSLINTNAIQDSRLRKMRSAVNPKFFGGL